MMRLQMIQQQPRWRRQQQLMQMLRQQASRIYNHHFAVGAVASVEQFELPEVADPTPARGLRATGNRFGTMLVQPEETEKARALDALGERIAVLEEDLKKVTKQREDARLFVEELEERLEAGRESRPESWINTKHALLQESLELTAAAT